MNDYDVRDAVERTLNLYVRLEYFEVGSAAGKMVIDESRVGRRRPAKIKRAPENVEERDALRIQELRRAIYAPPAVAPMITANGQPMRRVIPARDVAAIVRPHGHRGASPAATDRRMQLWKSTIATKLAMMNRSCVFCRPNASQKCRHVPALLDAAKLQVEIEVERNIAAYTERELGSRTGRKRLGLPGVREFERRRAIARSTGRDLVVARMRITRGETYEDAIDLFDKACATARAYCYREA